MEVAVGVLILGAASFSLWVLRRRKSMLREHVLRYQAVERYIEEEE
ncbi:MAG: hypothetical protein ACE5OY_08520 [Candidatus Bathyarchaeia archaeon]